MTQRGSAKSHPTSLWPIGAKQSEFNRSRLHSTLALVVGAILSIQAAGCCNNVVPRACGSMVDKLFSNYRECVWARRAYNLEYGNAPRRFGDHFRRGYVEGYCNICNGGDGYIPAMPPRDYWGYEFQSEEGSQCVAAWFDGYPAGVVAARKARAGKHSDMYISNMIDAAIKQDKSGVRLASDVKITTTAPPQHSSSRSTSSAASQPIMPAQTSPLELDDQTPPNPLEPAEPSMIIGGGS